MFHVRRELTRAEKEEYRRWRERHLRSLPQSVINPTRAERDAAAAKFWAKQSREQTFLLRDTPKIESGSKVYPCPPQGEEVHVRVDEMSEEELAAWQAREAAARAEAEARKLRTAPVYNKGGNQYWTDGMLADLKSGAHRRRP